MAIYSPKLVYLHPPKTGGTYITHLLRKTTKVTDLGHQHINFPELYRIRKEEWFSDKYIFTTIRHPITWYQSRWAFRIKTGWKAQHPLDFNCASNDFCTFVENVLKYKPDGWFTHIMQGYTTLVPNGVDKVIRMEDGLSNGLLDVMDSLNIKYNKKMFDNMEKANASQSKKARYTSELFDRVMKVESNIIDRYYYNFGINPNDHIR